MDVTQKKILEYLKHNIIALSKESDEEEIYMFNFLLENKLMSSTPNDSLHINNNGKDFLRNANYFNPVPMNASDWIDNIINQLKDGEKVLDGHGSLFEQTKRELKQDRIIEQGSLGYLTTLSTKGREYVNSGLAYNDFLSGKNTFSLINTTGHVFNNSPITQSHLDANINVPTNSYNAISPKTDSKTSLLEKSYWVAGIVLTIIAVYEFYLKYHLTWR